METLSKKITHYIAPKFGLHDLSADVQVCQQPPAWALVITPVVEGALWFGIAYIIGRIVK